MGCRETNVTVSCHVDHRICSRRSTTTTTTLPRNLRSCCRHRCRCSYHYHIRESAGLPITSGRPLTVAARLLTVVVIFLLALTNIATALPMSPRQQYDELVPVDALRPHVDAMRVDGTVRRGSPPSVDARRVPSLPPSSLTGVHVDDSTSFTVRFYKLFSREAQGHVRVTSSKVDAKGSFDDPYTNLRALSTGFESQMRIQSVSSGSFLCFNTHGRLVVKDDVVDTPKIVPDMKTRDDVTSRRNRTNHRRQSLSDGSSTRQRHYRRRGPRTDPLCVFHERHSIDGFTELQSAYNQSWFVAFGQSGRVRRDDGVSVIDRPAKSGSSSSSSSSGSSRRRRQFLKTDFAYVGDSGSSETNLGHRGTGSLVGNRRRAKDSGSGVRSTSQRQQHEEQHVYNGPAIDYRRVFAKLRSTTSSVNMEHRASSRSSSSQLNRRRRRSARTTSVSKLTT